MMRRYAVGAVLAMLSLSLVHCASLLDFEDLRPARTSGDAAHDAGDDAPSTDADADLGVTGVYAEDLCAWYERCDRNRLFTTGFGATCRETERARVEAIVNARGSALTVELLQACFLKLGATSCADDLLAVPECKFKGALPDDEPCAFDAQCATGWCNKAPGECGRCRPRAPRGTPCDDSTWLDEQGRLCEDGTTCFDGTCRAAGRDGDACESFGDCSFYFRCTEEKRCRPQVGENQRCVDVNSCDYAKGLECYNIDGANQTACKSPFPADVGQSCGWDSVLAKSSVCVRSDCVDGVCAPLLGLGEVVPDTGTRRCANTLVARDGRCVEDAPIDCR